MTHEALKGREVILEFSQIGGFVKVTAMDTETMTEISVQGPANAGEEVLKRNAMRRLEYVLRKKGILA